MLDGKLESPVASTRTPHGSGSGGGNGGKGGGNGGGPSGGMDVWNVHLLLRLQSSGVLKLAHGPSPNPGWAVFHIAVATQPPGGHGGIEGGGGGGGGGEGATGGSGEGGGGEGANGGGSSVAFCRATVACSSSSRKFASVCPHADSF